MRRRRNKKGTIQDIIFIIIALVVVTVGSLIAFKMASELNDEYQASDDIPTRGKTAISAITNMYPGVIDNAFMLLVIGLCIVALALASMVRVHPVFFVFFIIILVIIIVLGGIFSNIYQRMADNSEFESLADQLTYMTYTMRFLPFLTGVMGFLISFIMYKTWKNA